MYILKLPSVVSLLNCEHLVYIQSNLVLSNFFLCWILFFSVALCWILFPNVVPLFLLTNLSIKAFHCLEEFLFAPCFLTRTNLPVTPNRSCARRLDWHKWHKHKAIEFYLMVLSTHV